jgi:beta-phosphoglucomutase
LQAGLIFDLDGVLTDTEEFHYRSWRRLADELGVPFSRAAGNELRGRSRGHALDLFLGERRVGREEREGLLARKNEYFLAQIADLEPDDLAPGALPLLHEARAAGVGLGLASSSRNARLVCRRLGILDLFEAFVDGCSGLRPKPSPDAFLWAAGRLGLEPAGCVVVEDSEAGVRAGLAGGFRVAGVGPAERVGAAHLVLAGLEGASLADLLAAGEKQDESAEDPGSAERGPERGDTASGGWPA